MNNIKLATKCAAYGLLFTSLALGVVSTGYADDDLAKRKTDMQALDTDKDGFLSRTEGELDSVLKTRFEEFDRNLDEKIDEEEYMAIFDTAGRKTRPVFMAETFNELDTDANGVLTKVELSKNIALSEMLSDMDSNKDGNVDNMEAEDYEARRKQSVE